jgi:hypothetical protein
MLPTITSTSASAATTAASPEIKDLIQLVGVIPIYWLPGKLRCEKCKRREHLKEDVHSFSGADFGKLPIRRLSNVRFVREVTWDDGVL